MTDEELDVLFARVFATPDGAELLRALGNRRLTIIEITQRVARARRIWETGKHNG